MNRRGIFRAVALAGGALVAALREARAEEKPANEKPADEERQRKIVYHLNEVEKVDFVLRNIRHHFDGPGADNPIIALVVHGPALQVFGPQGSGASKDKLSRLLPNGVKPYACLAAMRGMNLDMKDMPDGFIATEKGVVRLAELQEEGYLYIRP